MCLILSSNVLAKNLSLRKKARIDTVEAAYSLCHSDHLNQQGSQKLILT